MRKALRRVLAVLALGAFVAVMPTTALTNAAEPVTIGDWLRQIYVVPSRKIDRSVIGLAAAPPPLPAVVLQTSSVPTPPKAPVVRNPLPDFWMNGLRPRGRRRRRRARP